MTFCESAVTDARHLRNAPSSAPDDAGGCPGCHRSAELSHGPGVWGPGLPLDFRSNLARHLAEWTLRPLRTIPPSVVAAGVHTPSWSLSRPRRLRPQLSVDRSAGTHDRPQHDGETGVGNSKPHQPDTDADYNEKVNNESSPTRPSGTRHRCGPFPLVDLGNLREASHRPRRTGAPSRKSAGVAC